LATYKSDIILIAGSGDFAFEAANFLSNKEKLNQIVLISKNEKIFNKYKKIISSFDIRDIENIDTIDSIFIEYNKILNHKLGHIQK